FEDQYQKTIEAAALSEVQERFGKLADAKYDLVKGDLSRAAVYLLKWSAAEEPDALLDAVKQYESKSVTNKLDKLVRINEFLVEKVKKTERFLIYSLFRVANRTFHHLLVQPKAQWDKYWTIAENLIVAEERTALEPALETTLRYLRMGVFSGPLIDQTCSMITGLVHSAASSNKLIEEKAQEIVKARALQSDIPWKDLWDAFQKNTGISDADGYVLREAIEAQTENAIREQQQKMDADKAAAELIAQEQSTKRRRNKRGGQRRQTGNRQIQVSQKKPAQQEVVEKAEKKPVKDDQKTSELLRLGLEQGIAFRIQEVKEIKRRLKIASENLASDGSADLRQFKNCLDSLTGDLDRLEKHSVVSTDGDQVSKLMGYVCQVDDHLLEGRKLLRDLARLSSNREKFDTELKSLIKSETLRAGRTDGGRISDHNIDFEFIEAWYHGLKLDLRKKEVVISGATRKLAPNEALVLYVTLSSRTQDVKYCISIGLWEMRTVSDPVPSKHDRNQFLGTMNLDQKIDPDLWKYTGKRMAVLHIVSPEVLRKGSQS
ncbi:MAG: hypothetical protein MI743_03695, partial [Sneathiellales bacterium]|nr:hypothetical protein [Sneathiellales bacterium]